MGFLVEFELILDDLLLVVYLYRITMTNSTWLHCFTLATYQYIQYVLPTPKTGDIWQDAMATAAPERAVHHGQYFAPGRSKHDLIFF